MEFTIEEGKLYMLQTRSGKRTATAALKIACDLVDEGMVDEKKAVLMVDPKQLDALLHPQFDEKALKAAEPIGRGLAASPGAACGRVVFTAEDAVEWAKKGEKVILVRLETSPEDIEGMHASKGILTVRGGMTSHAAVVARGMGTCCVSGCGEIVMDEENKRFTLGGKTIKEGDWISIDGSAGNIYGEAIPTVEAQSAQLDASWPGPTNTAPSESAPTRTRQRMPKTPTSSARRASAFAAPSICSSIPTAFPQSAR